MTTTHVFYTATFSNGTELGFESLESAELYASLVGDITVVAFATVSNHAVDITVWSPVE